MLRGIFTSNKKKRGAFQERYSNLARKRKISALSERINHSRKSIEIPRSVLLILVVVAAFFVLLFSLNSSFFSISQVTLVNPVHSNQDAIKEFVKKYQGVNILRVTEGGVSSEIKQSYGGIEKVYLYKRFPDEISIEIVESTPMLMFANIESILLVKNNGDLAGRINGIEELKLLDYEKKILKGESDLEADYVRERYLADLESDEGQKIKWEEVKDEDKQKTLDLIKNEVGGRVVKYREYLKEFVSKTQYASLPIFFAYEIETVDRSTMFFAVKVLDGLRLRGLNSLSNIFSSRYTLQVELDSNKSILFSSRREIEDQFRDLDSIIFHGKFSEGRIIDLRSENYSITR